MQRRMDELMDSIFKRDTDMTSYRNPVFDMTESDDALHLTVEVPGVDKENITLSVDDNTLSIEAKHEEKHENTTSKTQFYKALRLPRRAETDNIKASYKNGVLEVTIPTTTAENANIIDIE